jgi:replicative DNA helicase
MSEAKYLPAADALPAWRDEVLTGTPPKLYPAGTGDLGQLEIGPGLVTLFGGAPGSGKTALVMQLLLDALRLTPDLRAVVCNVEMAPAALLDRQLARLSGVNLSLIRHRKLAEAHGPRIEQALATLEPLAERLAFVRPPFDLTNLAATADAFEAGLIALDYVQRIAPPGDHGDRRGAVDATMAYLREFADADMAVVVVAAVARSKDRKGRASYAEGLGLASFRESSELEFGADDAFLLAPDPNDSGAVTLRHLESRHGEPKDVELSFDGRLQRFTPAASSNGPKADDGKVQAALAALWDRTQPASDPQAEDDGGER